MLAILISIAGGTAKAEDYFLGLGESKIKEKTLEQDKDGKGFGIFASSGNAHSFQRNGKVENYGVTMGKVEAEGKESKQKSKEGEVIVSSQGNGVVSVAYSPFSNKRDIDKKITSVENAGLLSGRGKLKGGKAEIHGTVESIVVGNGLGAYGLADFGEIKGSDGSDTGSAVDGTAGSSRGGRGSRRSAREASLSTSNHAEKPKNLDPNSKPDPADFYGKNNKISIGEIRNSGSIEGEIELATPEGYPREKGSLFGEKDLTQPQWRDVNTTSSGNGVGSYAYITTPTRLNFSEEKENSSSIDRITNDGNIQGNADLKTGNQGTHTNIRSFSSGNGISSLAYTNNNAKQKTMAKIGNVENRGTIKGNIEAEVGSNTATGWHEYSNAIIKGSGNGISTYARSSNGQVKISKATIGNIQNHGVISGELFAKAGSGYGENMAQIESSGNGIASFVSGGGKESKESSQGKIENQGIILGKAIVYGGKDKEGAEKKVEEKRHHLPIYDKSIPKGTSDNEAENKNRWLSTENEILKKYKEEKEKAKKEIEKIKKEIHSLDSSIENKKESIRNLGETLDQTLEEKEKAIVTEIQNYYKEDNKRKEIEKKLDTLKWLSGEENRKKEEKLRKKLEKLETWKLSGILKSDVFEVNSLEAYNAIYEDIEENIAVLQKEKKQKEKELKNSFIVEAIQGKIKELEKKIAEEEQKLSKKVVWKVSKDMKETVDKTKKEIQELEKKIAVLKEQEKKVIPLTKSNHKENTIQTTTDMYASGNGISIQGEGGGTPNSSSKVGRFAGLENEGLISGYSEVYHGYSQKDYTRIAHQGSGAGIAVRGNVDVKITNAGVISGSDFALLAEGKIDDSQSIHDPSFKSGFLGGVENYGILAGRVIIGGHRVDPQTEEGYRYFETIYNTKNPHNNYGMYVIYKKDGSIKDIISGEKKGTYKGKDIINIRGESETYSEQGENIHNKVINGVAKNGLIQVGEGKKVEIGDSILNALEKTIVLENKGEVVLQNTIVNTNSRNFGNTYSVVGSAGENVLRVSSGSTINGNVDLGAGNDTIIVSGKNYFNGKISLGEGENTLRFEKAPSRRIRTAILEASGNTTPSNSFIAEVENASRIEVKEDVRFTPTTKITGVKEIEIEKGKVLEYRFAGKEKQAFSDLEGKELKINSEEGFKLVAIGEKLQIGKVKEVLGYALVIEKAKLEEKAKQMDFFVDSRAIPSDFYSKKAFEAYVRDYKKTGKNILEAALKSEGTFKEYLYDMTYSNPSMLIKDGSLSLAKEYHSLLADSKFLQKGKIEGMGSYVSHEKEYDKGNRIQFQGGLGKIAYGVSNQWNASLYFGGGEFKTGGKQELKAESIMTGAELKYQKNMFTWTNSWMYSQISPKDLGRISAYSFYTQGKYSVPISETWKFVPAISAMVTRLENKEGEWKEAIVAKQKEAYFQSELSMFLEKELSFEKAKWNVYIGSSYAMKDGITDGKAHWKGGESEFSLQSLQNRKDVSAELGLSYEHSNGLSSKISWKHSKRKQTMSFGLGYYF